MTLAAKAVSQVDSTLLGVQAPPRALTPKPRVRWERVARLTTDQYDAMVRAGVLSESPTIELIDGVLVWKDRSKRGENAMSIGREHSWSVERLSRIGRALEPMGYFVQTQQPIILSPYSEPEPDGSVVRGNLDDFRAVKPTSEDTLCVVEVADNSLSYDRHEKLSLYAEAGVAQYIIINLVDRVVEIYTKPIDAEYRSRAVFSAGQSFAVQLGDGREHLVIVEEVIP